MTEKDALTREIRGLLKERNAILLAHNYQPPEIQDLADLCGDSLELSRKAAATGAEVIVFAGVHFMAETASILCPDKTVLLPRLDAGCQMADMITAHALAERKKDFPGVPVVTYVNSPATVKAITDVCCTSANAVGVVTSLAEDAAFMAPDRNLAQYTAARTGKKVHFWDGYCPIHDNLTPEEIQKARKAHPDALVMAHPECRPEVLELADEILSTSGMLRVARESDRREFIVGTEVGILYPLTKQNPGKIFYPASEHMVCPDMKKIRPSDIRDCLANMTNEVKVPEDIRVPAYAAVERMIQITS